MPVRGCGCKKCWSSSPRAENIFLNRDPLLACRKKLLKVFEFSKIDLSEFFENHPSGHPISQNKRNKKTAHFVVNLESKKMFKYGTDPTPPVSNWTPPTQNVIKFVKELQYNT